MPSQDQIDALAKRLAKAHRTHGNIDDRLTDAAPLREVTPEGTMINVEQMIVDAKPYWQTWQSVAWLTLRQIEDDNA